jgi:uncharacterized BrkB/YihY/UPF0761 family membrane protein
VVGVSQIVTAIATGLIGVSGVSWLNRILLIASAVLINVVVLAGSFQILTARHLTWRQLLPGAVGAGFFFAILQVVGTTVVLRAITRATPVYGTFATVIGLMMWLSLHAMVALLGVEANVALDRGTTTSRTLTSS